MNSDKNVEKLPLVIMCSNTSFEENPLGAKPLALSLAKKCKVIYVDPPLSYLTALKRPELRASLFSKRFRKIDENLYRLTPVVAPGKDRPFIHLVTSFMLKQKVLKSIKKLKGTFEGKPLLIVTAPHYRIFSESTFNIYWMMDDYASQPELVGIDEKILSEGQKYLSTHSDEIVVVSNSLQELLGQSDISSKVITNGADDVFFRFPAKPSVAFPQHVSPKLPENNFALYVGGISDRVDITYLQDLNRSGVPVVIAGGVDPKMDRTSFDQLCESSNITYLGSIQNDLMPELMNLGSVGLVPYKEGPFNKASMPLKIPEYLMCGMPVVSSKLEFTEAFNDDDVYREPNPKAFTQRVKEILLDPAKPSQRAMRSARIAKDWSWDKKADEFLKLAR